MRILVVEDQPLIALGLVDALEAAGYGVVGPARSSGEAVLLATSSGLDLALIDIDLEKKGVGIALAHRLKAEHEIPVIFTTGQWQLARDSGDAVALIRKPYSSDDVVQSVAVVDAILRGQTLPVNKPLSLELFPTCVCPVASRC